MSLSHPHGRHECALGMAQPKCGYTGTLNPPRMLGRPVDKNCETARLLGSWPSAWWLLLELSVRLCEEAMPLSEKFETVDIGDK